MDKLKRYTAIVVFIMTVSIILIYNYIGYFAFENSELYVYLRYADNVVDGNGLVYNVGEFVEHYSSMMWVFLISIFRLMTNKPEMIMYMINTVALLLVIVFVYKICLNFDIKKNVLLQFLLVLLLSTSICLMYWTTNGSGIIVLSFLFIITIYIKQFMHKSWFYKHIWILYLLLIISGIEGCIFVILLILIEIKNYIFAKPKNLTRINNSIDFHVLYNGLMVLLIVTAYLIFKLIYYETIIPETMISLKDYRITTSGIKSIIGYFTSYYPTILLLFIPFIKEKPPFIVDISLITLGYIIFVGITNYSIGVEHRALVPVIPLILIQITFVAKRIFKYMLYKKSQKGIAMLIIVLIGLLNCKTMVRDGELLDVIYENEIVRSGKQVGNWLKRHYPSGTRIAAFNVPVIAYESKMYIKNLIESFIKYRSYKRTINEAMNDNYDIILEDAVFIDKKAKKNYNSPIKSGGKYVRKTTKIENPIKRNTENRFTREHKSYNFSDIGLYIYQYPDTLFGGGIIYNFDYTLSYLFNTESKLKMMKDTKAQSFDVTQLSKTKIVPEKHKNGQLQRLNETGVAIAKVGNYEKAKNIFQRLIEKDSEFLNAYFNLGRTYIFMNDYRKAIEQFKIIIRKNPFFSEAYLLIGNIYNKYLNEKTNAIIYYNNYVNTTHDDAKRNKIMKNFLSK